MRLKKFLIILGLWVAILPHLGFSIITENVLFSITGFCVIIASFYLAALEDKHKNKRVIDGEILQEASQKAEVFLGHVNRIKKQTIQKITPDRKEVVKERKTVVLPPENFEVPQKKEIEDIAIEADDGRPRIKKAVSDVKIKTDSIDDLVS